MKTDIKTYSKENLAEYLASIREKKFRTDQIYEWLWKKNASSFEEMTNLPNEFRENLNKKFAILSIKIHSKYKSKDLTVKYSFETHDKLFIEGVLIPSRYGTTACISTQVGCSLNCKFCATGLMDFKRNLTAGEIYEQVFLLNNESVKEFGHKLSNIVIMGMGEPLLNYENTISAIEKMTSEQFLAFSPQRITLSTAGISKMIKKLADDEIKFNLAISLHSADDLKRSDLMPVNKSNPVDSLIESIKYFNKKTGKRITIEYLLLGEYNDTLKDAKDLAAFCKNFPCKINIIEYNLIENSKYKKSKKDNIAEFIGYLESKNIVVNLRKSKGEDIAAACGQLANKQNK